MESDLFTWSGVIPVICVIIYFLYSDYKRRHELAAWAWSKGWRVEDGDVQSVRLGGPVRRFLDIRESINVVYYIIGEHHGRPILIMEYSGNGPDNKPVPFQTVGVVILKTEFPVLPLTIRREKQLDKLGGVFGSNDIDFEAAEFNRKFFVQSNNRRWAYDVIHQRTMELLLASPSYNIAFERQEIVVSKDGPFSAKMYDEALALAWGIYELIPDYVRERTKDGTYSAESLD